MTAGNFRQCSPRTLLNGLNKKHVFILIVFIVVLTVSRITEFKADKYFRLKTKNVTRSANDSLTNVSLVSSNWSQHPFYKENKDIIPSQRDAETLRDLFLEFEYVWRQKHGLDFLLYGGSLVGAYRHAGRIFFDDDVDVSIDVKHQKLFYHKLTGSKLKAVNYGNIRKVFFSDLSRSYVTRLGRWPSIDVVFYKFIKNGTQLSMMDQPDYGRTKDYLPPILLPYEGRLVPAPRCVMKVIRSYDYASNDIEKTCCSHSYNHKLEKFRKSSCTPCKNFHGLFQFTSWERLNSTHCRQKVLPADRSNLKWRDGMVLEMPACS